MPHFYFCLLLVGINGFIHHRHFPRHQGKDADDHNHNHHHPTEGPGYFSYRKITGSNANFAFTLFQEIVSEAGDKNVFFSPMSISTAFALVSLGAKARTLSQLLSGFGFSQTEITEQERHDGFRYLLQMLKLPKAELELNVGNALFAHDQVEFLEKFLNDAKGYYGAEILPANFKNSNQ